MAFLQSHPKPSLPLKWATWAKTIWDNPVIVTILQISAPVYQNMVLQIIIHPLLNPSNLIAQ